jgi:pimeloyl-ACP methyl ester carboxylesterase
MATFLLVHGTFAKSAHWPALQDGLSEAAHEAGEKACFKQLAWSGKNRAAARQAASAAILKSVQDIRSNPDNEKIFLIGHSHGGSAIAYFLKEHTDIAKTLSGCAFLSTPFIAMRPRNTEIAWAVFFLPLAAGSLLFNSIAQTSNVFVWAIALAVAIFVGIVFNVYGSSKFLERTIRQQTADIPSGNHFFMRCSGDEAATFLSAVQFINWLNMKASKVLMLISSWGMTGAAVLVLPFLLLLHFLLQDPQFAGLGIVGVIKGLIKDLIEEPPRDYAAYFFALFLLGASFLFVSCLLLGFLIFLSQAITSRVFGWTSLATGFLVELAIEPVPFGTHSLVHVDWSTGSTAPKGLAHSWTYAHPEAIRHLQNWVRESLLLTPRPESNKNFQPQDLQPTVSS